MVLIENRLFSCIVSLIIILTFIIQDSGETTRDHGNRSWARTTSWNLELCHRKHYCHPKCWHIRTDCWLCFASFFIIFKKSEHNFKYSKHAKIEWIYRTLDLQQSWPLCFLDTLNTGSFNADRSCHACGNTLDHFMAHSPVPFALDLQHYTTALSSL